MAGMEAATSCVALCAADRAMRGDSSFAKKTAHAVAVLAGWGNSKGPSVNH